MDVADGRAVKFNAYYKLYVLYYNNYLLIYSWDKFVTTKTKLKYIFTKITVSEIQNVLKLLIFYFCLLKVKKSDLMFSQDLIYKNSSQLSS